MLAQILDSLQRGISVLRDGQAVNAQLGGEYLVDTKTPVRQFSSRPSAEPERMPSRVVDNPTTCRTGRSARAGVLSSGAPTSVGGAACFRWSRVPGGSSLPAVVAVDIVAVKTVAGKDFPALRPAGITHLLGAWRHAGGGKPGCRIPPASRRGQGS